MTKVKSLVYFIIYLAALFLIRWYVNRSFHNLPSDSDIWFASGLLLVVLGVFLTEKYFTKPLDVLVNIVTLLIVLITADSFKTFSLYKELYTYAIIIGIMALASFVLFDTNEDPDATKQKIANGLYNISTFLGSSKILFSIVFILAFFNYFIFSLSNGKLIDGQQQAALSLIVFWGAVILIEPFDSKIVQPILNFFKTGKTNNQLIGKITKRYLPNIIIVEQLANSPKIKPGDLAYVGSYNKNFGDSPKLAIFIEEMEAEDTKLLQFYLFEPDSLDITKDLYVFNYLEAEASQSTKDYIAKADIFKNREQMIGIISSSSNIDVIKIKMLGTADQIHTLEQGDLVCVNYYKYSTKYQIINAETSSESVDGESKKGTKTITAQQIGHWVGDKQKFETTNWVPDMNSLVFIEKLTDAADIAELGVNNFKVGTVPKSKYPIYINFENAISHHIAIIGKTGTGKTQMAAKMITRMASEGYKIVIFEVDRSHQECLSRRLNQDSVQEQDYNTFNLNTATKNIISIIWQFDRTDTQGGPLSLSDLAIGVIEKIIIYQQNHQKQKMCIVMEEAYDFIPENSFGNQGFGQPKVSRISQQALKCRKHNIGFMIITQRTALVTKNILYQCHTIIALQTFDETSKNFLGAYIDNRYLESMSILPRFRGIVVGKGSSCDKPVIVNFEEPKIIQELITPTVNSAPIEVVVSE